MYPLYGFLSEALRRHYHYKYTILKRLCEIVKHTTFAIEHRYGDSSLHKCLIPKFENTLKLCQCVRAEQILAFSLSTPKSS